jgi:hypothetical protein
MAIYKVVEKETGEEQNFYDVSLPQVSVKWKPWQAKNMKL